jgi:hypothetical protein
MKKILLLIFFLSSLLAYSQNDAIAKFVLPTRDTEYKRGNIKTIKVKRMSFTKNKGTIDTLLLITKIEFSKTGLFSKRLDYDKFGKITQIIDYDKAGRIEKIQRLRNDTLSVFAKQFFSQSSEYPDSLNIYWGSEKKSEQYINHFVKKLLVKQEYYAQDTLRHYHLYSYDNKKRLIKDNFYNTPNGFGITLDKSITGDKDEKDLYPNDSTKYSYKTNKDTLIKIRDRMSYSLKDITKNYDCKDYSLTVKEEYSKNYLKNTSYKYTFKSKDSIYEIKYNYINNKEIKDYFKTTITSKNIISTWKMSGYFNDEERNEITQIETQYDQHSNWSKKIYSKDAIVLMLVEREIEYY